MFENFLSSHLNTETCKYEHSQFCDPHQKHIISGDLRLIDNSKLRKLMTKSHNYREHHILSFNKVFDNINFGIDSYIQDLSNQTKPALCRSSHQRYSIKKALLKSFAMSPGKHLCWSPFLIMLQLEMQVESPTQVFSCEYCEIFKNTYFEEHLRTAASVYVKKKLKPTWSPYVEDLLLMQLTKMPTTML